MPMNSIKRYYRDNEFVSLLPGFQIDDRQVRVLLSAINALALSESVAEVYRVQQGESAGVAVEWSGLPSEADLALIDGAVQAFTGATTTSTPTIVESLAATQSANGTPVKSAELQTPPLDGGVYTFAWNSTLKMNPAAANSGVQGTVRITRSDGVQREQSDSWDLTALHAFNGSIIFEVAAGQTLKAELFVVRLGSGGVAEMVGGRLTIYQLAAEGE